METEGGLPISERMSKLLQKKALDGDLEAQKLQGLIVATEGSKNDDLSVETNNVDDTKLAAFIDEVLPLESGVRDLTLKGEEPSSGASATEEEQDFDDIETEGENEISEDEKKKIEDDIVFVLARLSKETRSDPIKYDEYKDKIREAKARLLGFEINLDNHIRDIDSSLDIKDKNLKMGQNKADLREIFEKLKNSEELSENERKIASLVGLETKYLNVTQSEPEKKEGLSKDEESGTGRERPSPRVNSLEQRILNIGDYDTIKEQRDALETLLKQYSKKGEGKEDITLIKNALSRLDEKVDLEIQKFTERGEMRPELKEAVEAYYEKLENKYSAGGNILNSFDMAPLQEWVVVFDEMGKIGPDGKALAEKLNKELLSVGMLHDLKIMINNTTGATNDQMLKYAAAIKGEQFGTLLRMNDRLSEGAEGGGNDFVIKNLAAIDDEARKVYFGQRPGKRVFKLEDPEVEQLVKDRVGGDSLFYSVARDLYRVTGGEARYGVEGSAHQEENKGMSWTIDKNGDDNNGAFFRKAMNKRRDFAGGIEQIADGKWVLKFNPILWKHLDPGVKSYWEALWETAKKNDESTDTEAKFETVKEIGLVSDVAAGIPPREYAKLTESALRSLSFNRDDGGEVVVGNEKPLNVWMEDIGKVAGTMSKESQFLGSPNFKSFQSTLGADYTSGLPKIRVSNGVVRGIGRDEYLLERLGDLVEFMIKTDSMNRIQIAKELDEYRNSSFLFRTGNDLNIFKRKFDIPVTNREENKARKKVFTNDLFRKGKSGTKARGIVGGVAGSILSEILKDK